jgi:hypothetical protein
MLKKLRNYLIAFVFVFIIVLLGGHFFVELAWDEAALLAVFLAVIGVGTYWWREVGLGWWI